MKAKFITQAFDLVKPGIESDEKILAEILKFSKEYANRKNSAASVVKIFASVAACFLLVFAAVRFFGLDLAGIREKVNL